MRLPIRKKIDGKDAILLSAGTNGRTNGKIFVGLVQGDGSINWAYSYQVNTGAYQYSCMSELNDGTVALLYENGKASEKFEKYSIEQIAKDSKNCTCTCSYLRRNFSYSNYFNRKCQ